MFTPERLVLARKRRRMTLADLATKSGVSAQSITAFENGRRVPTEETLSQLSDALDYPLGFFASPRPVDLQLDQVSFRAPSKMTAMERESALGSGALAMDLNSWLGARFRLPPANLPTYPGEAPEDAAERLRAAWGLGEAPAPNMVHLLEANGVRVFSLPSDCLDIDAFSTTEAGTPFVFLNTRKSGERGRFDAAHELGHLILHCEHRIPHGRDSESEANDFASAFLMPRAGILAQQLHGASVDRIISAKRRWGVSAMALTYRLRRLDLLSEWRYTQIAKELTKRGYRAGEPGSQLGRESSQLLAKVFDALRTARDISPADIAGQLYIPQRELNDFVFGLVPVGLDGEGQTTAPIRPSLRLVHS
ncbi:helix-turn-helix domain-containing protein [Kitasatospora sp. NPDC048298]|uniref:helix-turn-helix domain-containing protein n=1 Tax=Kitasatospora sp. NPDC048298 TaxID=3364049 RepID=UPI00371428F8